jgi:uncharacterized OB-fold protein
MEFKDFSLYINQTKVGRFAEELAAGRIMATRCRTCGIRFYPPRADCPRCMESHLEWIEVKGRGKLATFTIIQVPPERFAPKVAMPFSSMTFHPCPVGILEVEDGLKIMGWVPQVEPKDLQVGMPLQATPHTLADGKVTILLEPITSKV